jgi:hypothetical protein
MPGFKNVPMGQTKGSESVHRRTPSGTKARIQSAHRAKPSLTAASETNGVANMPRSVGSGLGSFSFKIEVTSNLNTIEAKDPKRLLVPEKMENIDIFNESDFKYAFSNLMIKDRQKKIRPFSVKRP